MNTPTPSRRDLYARATDKIVDDLERGVRTWARPWNGAHAAGPITRPLRFNDAPTERSICYSSGVNGAAHTGEVLQESIPCKFAASRFEQINLVLGITGVRGVAIASDGSTTPTVRLILTE